MTLFLAVSLCMCGSVLRQWILARFPETIFHLDRQRAVLKRTLFHFQWVSEVAVTPESRAELAVAYRERRGAIYQIAFHGHDSTLKFGLPLAQLEKEWLVERINAFLHETVPV